MLAWFLICYNCLVIYQLWYIFAGDLISLSNISNQDKVKFWVILSVTFIT